MRFSQRSSAASRVRRMLKMVSGRITPERRSSEPTRADVVVVATCPLLVSLPSLRSALGERRRVLTCSASLPVAQAARPGHRSLLLLASALACRPRVS